MPLVTLDAARAHCRVDPDYPDDQLQGYVDAAVRAASDYLNRGLFEDQSALDAALDDVAGDIGTASDAYQEAKTAAAALPNPEAARAALAVADERWATAQVAATRTTYGIVATPAIISAIKLTIGHLFANRADVSVGASVYQMPLGTADLLRPYRRIMMP